MSSALIVVEQYDSCVANIVLIHVGIAKVIVVIDMVIRDVAKVFAKSYSMTVLRLSATCNSSDNKRQPIHNNK